MGVLSLAAQSKLDTLEAKPLSLPGGANYKPELDAIRFIAIFTVYIHHSFDPRAFSSFYFANALHYLWNSMGFGLFSFFILSGYLITTILLREREKSGTVDVPAFWLRRMLRIWPLYFVGITVGVAFSLYAHQPIGMRYVAFLLMAGNWYCYFVGGPYPPVSPLWSISVQEQFYIFWPLVVKRASRRAIIIISVMLMAIAVGTLIYLGHVHHYIPTIWFNGFVSYGLFGVGILLAVVQYRKILVIALWQRTILLMLCPICWFSASYFFHIREEINASSGLGVLSGYLLGAAGSFALLIGLLDIPKHFIPDWLSYLGRISYGMYTFHMFILVFVNHFIVAPLITHDVRGSKNLTSLIAAPLVVLVSALSYRYFETWFLKLKPQHA